MKKLQDYFNTELGSKRWADMSTGTQINIVNGAMENMLNDLASAIEALEQKVTALEDKARHNPPHGLWNKGKGCEICDNVTMTITPKETKEMEKHQKEAEFIEDNL